jgi:hypothetical protein
MVAKVTRKHNAQIIFSIVSHLETLNQNPNVLLQKYANTHLQQRRIKKVPRRTLRTPLTWEGGVQEMEIEVREEGGAGEV